MADITEIAIASWRLEKWLNNLNAERKMAAKSALRAIKKYLQENNIEVLDLSGTKFDTGLAVSVVNNESEEKDEEKLIIIEMVKPIILQNGSVIQYGQVVLGDTIKEEKPIDSVVDKVEEKETVSLSREVTNNSAENTNKHDKNRKIKWVVAVFGIMQIVVIALIICCICMVGTIKGYFPICIEFPVQKEISIPEYTSDFNHINERLSTIEQNEEKTRENIIRIENEVNEIYSKLDNKNNPITQKSEIYTVIEGDTIGKICEKYGYTYESLGKKIIEENKLDDPDRIYIGQELIIPINKEEER